MSENCDNIKTELREKIINHVVNELKDNKECELLFNKDLNKMSDKALTRVIETIVRHWDSKYNKGLFEREDNWNLMEFLEECCLSKGIRFDRIGLGNGHMSATTYKFIKEGRLIYDFGIMDKN